MELVFFNSSPESPRILLFLGQSSFSRYAFLTDLYRSLGGFLLLAVVCVNYWTIYPQYRKYWKY